MPDESTFNQWAILELFGHKRIAGLVSEQEVGGCSFVRVDIPNESGTGSHTSLYGQGAIYGMHFVSEEVAREMAIRLEARPVHSWEMPALTHDDPEKEEFPL